MSVSPPPMNPSPHEHTSPGLIYIKSSSPFAHSMDSIDPEAQAPSLRSRKSSIHAPYSGQGQNSSQPESSVGDNVKTHASLEEPRGCGRRERGWDRTTRGKHISYDNSSLANISIQSEWKPWELDEPYRLKMPKSRTTMEDWVKVMEASDDGMCKGWRDQIDTLIIFVSPSLTGWSAISSQRYLLGRSVLCHGHSIHNCIQ